MAHLGNWLVVSPWPYRLLRIGVGCVFIWAGTVKLMDPRAFARTLYEFGVVPDVLLPPVAVGLPAIEVLAGLGLLFDARGCLKTVTGLLALFLGVLGYGIFRGLDIDCGCFSPEEMGARGSLQVAFVRDLWLSAAVGFLFFRRWALVRFGNNFGFSVDDSRQQKGRIFG